MTNCNKCSKKIMFGSMSKVIIITSSNHQVFQFCSKLCARDFMVSEA